MPFESVPLTSVGTNYSTPPIQADFNLDQNEIDAYLLVKVSFPSEPEVLFDVSGWVYLDRLASKDVLKWDYHNRVESIEYFSTPLGSPPVKLGGTHYDYDVLGNLVAKRNTNGTDNPTDAEYYVNEGGKRLLQYDTEQRLVDHFLYGPDLETLLAVDQFQYPSGSNVPVDSLIWTLSDQNGTIRDLFQVGQSPQHLKYDAFGVPDASVVDQALARYLDMPWDDDFKIYWRGSRPYDPLSGRYLSPSNSGFIGGGTNPYLFENNTPVNRAGAGPRADYQGGYDGPSFWDEYAYAADPRNDFSRGDYVWGTTKSVAYVWGAVGAAFIGVYVAATAGIATGVGATTAWATAGTGATLGMTSGAISTYASNPDAGLHEYAFGAGLGGALGAGNLVGSAASLVGGGSGALITGATGNDWRTGYQIGDLVGGIGAVGIDDGIRAYGKFAAGGAKGAMRNALLHGATHAGVEGFFAAAGGAVGYYNTGTLEGALYGANLGSMAGGTAANFLVACFTAKTPVLVSVEGHSRLAEDVRENDLLLARDENNPDGPLELKRVEEVFIRQSPVIELVVRGKIIGTTAEHPFFVVRLKRFIPAQHLEIGESFLSHDGQLVVLDGVRYTDHVETVYNFRIADHHTYFVGGKEWGFSVWVHNARYQGAELAKAGVPFEDMVSARTGVARNMAPQERILSKGREFILDFKMQGENGSIALRNSILEAKGGDRIRLSGRDRRQIRAMVEQVKPLREEGNVGLIAEVVTNYKPQRGEFYRAEQRGLLKFISPDDL